MMDRSVLESDSADIPNPIGLCFETTNKCNLRCKLCPRLFSSKTCLTAQEHSNEDTIKNVIKIAKKFGKILLNGMGEPFTNPGFISILKLFNENKIAIDFSTNGLLVDTSTALKLMEIDHLRCLNFSIDSIEPEEYEFIRGADLAKAIKGMENLLAVGFDPGRMSVSARVLEFNLSSLAKFPERLSKLGVRYFNIQIPVNFNKCKTKDRFIVHDYKVKSVFSDIVRNCLKYGVMPVWCPSGIYEKVTNESVGYFDLISEVESVYLTKNCNIAWECPFIDKDGNVFACFYASIDSKYIVGNINQKSFEEIWRGERYARFRNALLSEETTPEICRICDVTEVIPVTEHSMCYNAKILTDKVRASENGNAVIHAKNTGNITWSRNDMVNVGTSSPKDRQSKFFNDQWLSQNRPCTFTEDTVPSGDVATFMFKIIQVRRPFSEKFQLVIEDKRWIPNTEFEVSTSEDDQYGQVCH